MKLFKLLSHPMFLICFFPVLLISGESFGSVYLFYIILALPYGSIHALLAVAGISLLTFSLVRFDRLNKFLIEPLLNLAGVLCLVLSLYYFFHNDKSNYNIGTLEQSVPLVMLCLFGLFCLIFTCYNILSLFKKNNVHLKRV